MRLSEETQAIIKNFALSNKSIYIAAGNTIRTVTPSKAILATAHVKETFDKPVCIYELNRFLSAYSLFENPEIELYDKFLIIKEGKKSIRYFYADKNAIITPPDGEIEFPDPEISIQISGNDLQTTLRAANVLSLPHVVITQEEDETVVYATNIDNPSSDRYNASVSDITVNGIKDFKVVFSVENLMKLMVKDYTVDITSSGFSRFKSDNIEYLMGLEESSEF